MSRTLSAKTRRELLDATPQPDAWPVCGECGREFVLRRALLARSDGKGGMDLSVGWTWSRDCSRKHGKTGDRIERARKPRKERRRGR